VEVPLIIIIVPVKSQHALVTDGWDGIVFLNR